MVNAKLSEDNVVLIEYLVQGICGEYKDWAMADSGFSGAIALPLPVALEIGLSTTGYGRILLADGSITSVPICVGKVKLDADVYECPILIVGGEDVLIGMDLMKNYKVCFSAKERKVTVTKDGATAKQIAELYTKLESLVP